jgi:hypothetical protein
MLAPEKQRIQSGKLTFGFFNENSCGSFETLQGTLNIALLPT